MLRSFNSGLILTLALCAVSFALTALPMKVTCQKNESVKFCPLFRQALSAASEMTPSVVSGPSHGVISFLPKETYYWKRIAPTLPRKRIPITWMKYTPSDPNFTGVDSFTWRIEDGSGDVSDIAACVVRVHPLEPGGMTVLILTTPSVLSGVSAEVNRLKADLEDEGYSARIAPFSGSTTKAVWDTLTAEYDKPGQFLAGALLLGNIPYYDLYGELYWNLSVYLPDFKADSMHLYFGDSVLHGADTVYNAIYSTFGLRGRNLTNIWTSRFWALNIGGTGPSVWGSEAAIMKRMLDANHDFRKGVSRLPHRAYWYDEYNSKKYQAGKLAELWSWVKKDSQFNIGHTLTGYTEGNGGDFMEIMAEMNTGQIKPFWNSKYAWNIVTEDTLMNRPLQQRFVLLGGCHAGQVGRIAGAHLMTRGGGAVMVASNADYTHGWGSYCLAETSLVKADMRRRLAAGEPWGRAWMNSGMALGCTYHWGDMSLKIKRHPSNELPVVDSLVRSRPGSGKFRFTAAARDPDGMVQSYEWWFNKPYNRGRNEPDSVTSVPVVEVDSSRCTTDVRLETIDNYKARFYLTLPKAADQILGTGKTRSLAPALSTLVVGPNPVAQVARISFAPLPSGALVTLRIFNASGRMVADLSDRLGQGTASVTWNGKGVDGSRLACGIYTCRLTLAGKSMTRSLVLAR